MHVHITCFIIDQRKSVVVLQTLALEAAGPRSEERFRNNMKYFNNAPFTACWVSSVPDRYNATILHNLQGRQNWKTTIVKIVVFFLHVLKIQHS